MVKLFDKYYPNFKELVSAYVDGILTHDEYYELLHILLDNYRKEKSI